MKLISYGRFGKSYSYHLKVSRIQEVNFYRRFVQAIDTTLKGKESNK